MSKQKVFFIALVIFMGVTLWRFSIEINSMETFRYQDPQLLGSLQLPDADNYSWLLYAEEYAENPNWNKKIDWIKGEERNVYWAKYPIIWGLGTTSSIYSKITGESLRSSIESVLPFFYTAIYILTGGLVLLYSTFRFGITGSLGALLYLFSPYILFIWEPYRVDHHGLISGLCYLGTIGFISFLQTKRILDVVISSICFGAIAWVSFLNLIPIALTIGSVILLAELYNKWKRIPPLLPPTSYLIYGVIIASITYLAYLTEYRYLPFKYEFANPIFCLFILAASITLFSFTSLNASKLCLTTNLKYIFLLGVGFIGLITIITHIVTSRLLYVFDPYFVRVMDFISESLPTAVTEDIIFIPLTLVILIWWIYSKREKNQKEICLLVLATIGIAMTIFSFRNASTMLAVTIPCLIGLTNIRARWVLIIGLVMVTYQFTYKALNDTRFGKPYQLSDSQLTLMQTINQIQSRPTLIAADPMVATSIYYFTGIPIYTNLYLESKESLSQFMKAVSADNATLTRFMKDENIDTLVLNPKNQFFYNYVALGKIGLFQRQGFRPNVPGFEAIDNKDFIILHKKP